MNGWIGKIARVDLTRGTVKVEDLDPVMAMDYVGARGLGTKIFFDEVDPKVDPSAPENKVIFATGPLTGTAAISGSRYNVVTKAPLTGAIAASNSGGYFGAELKYAGFDAVIIEGKSSAPVYLWIENGRAEIRSASHLWGKTTHEAEDIIKTETDHEAKVAVIGPAGERLVKYACVVNDKHRAAGRSGVGAVLGSKNFKGIAVRGTGSVTVADAKGFREAMLDSFQKIKANPVTSAGLPTYGTAVLTNIINAHGIFPTRNFQTGTFAGAEKISGEAMVEKTLIRKKGCTACPIACGRVTQVTDGRFKGAGEGPEYEPLFSLGSDCDIDNLEAVTKANYLANELGYDPISFGATLACAMELYDKGYLPGTDSEVPLRFGDADLLVEAARKVGYREGIGDLLAEGSYRLAAKYGHPELSMSSKKQEYPAYDPRGSQAIGLNYATSNRGGCHVRGYTISPEILGLPEKIDPLTSDGKPAWVKGFQDLTALVDSAGMCLFTTFALGAPEITAMLETVTGAGFTVENAVLAGERIWNLERIFNLTAGLTAADDTLAPRLLEEPMPEGPAKGRVVELAKMLPEYYQLRGWDAQGVPTRETLAKLGLESEWKSSSSRSSVA